MFVSLNILKMLKVSYKFIIVIIGLWILSMSNKKEKISLLGHPLDKTNAIIKAITPVFLNTDSKALLDTVAKYHDSLDNMITRRSNKLNWLEDKLQIQAEQDSIRTSELCDY